MKFNFFKKSENSSSENNDNKDLIKRLALLIGVLLGVLVLILFIMWIASLLSSNTYSYSDVEKIMKDAAISYFKDNKKSLPKENQKVEIADSTLIKHEYMDSLDEYLGEDNNCSGKVSVQKIDNEYVYTPYLNCGNDYNTKELYKEVKKKTITKGEGLYNLNGTYIYRGEKVNNYVKLDRSLWRIVKIMPDNRIMLILDSTYSDTYMWDDRFNASSEYNSGINDYKASRIREFLEKIYKDKDRDSTILSTKDKTKLTTFDLCIGKRSIDSNYKDNSEECSEVLKNQKIGLLTVSDYLFASIDKNCIKTTDYSCQNYNYLVSDYEWALVTAVSGTTDEIFMISDNGVVSNQQASAYGDIRPVIVLNNSTMVKSGNGTKKKPYKVK